MAFLLAKYQCSASHGKQQRKHLCVSFGLSLSVHSQDSIMGLHPKWPYQIITNSSRAHLQATYSKTHHTGDLTLTCENFGTHLNHTWTTTEFYSSPLLQIRTWIFGDKAKWTCSEYLSECQSCNLKPSQLTQAMPSHTTVQYPKLPNDLVLASPSIWPYFYICKARGLNWIMSKVLSRAQCLWWKAYVQTRTPFAAGLLVQNGAWFLRGWAWSCAQSTDPTWPSSLSVTAKMDRNL